jgi:hypothetical protein
MEEPLSTKVTKINNRWHCRLFRGEKIIDEMACSDQRDVGFCMYTMLRWYAKMSYLPVSPMAEATRHRNKPHPKTGAKIWYQKDLPC